MTAFADLNITVVDLFAYPKISIKEIVNCPIVIRGYELRRTAHKEECAVLSIEHDGRRLVVFTGSRIIRRQLEQVPPSAYPITAKIKADEASYKLT